MFIIWILHPLLEASPLSQDPASPVQVHYVCVEPRSEAGLHHHKRRSRPVSSFSVGTGMGQPMSISMPSSLPIFLFLALKLTS